MDKKNLPFWLLTLSVFAALILPILVRDGMFLDGLLYSVLSRNLAQGKGSFWYPHLSQTYFSAFHEHPPLVFGIQSLFFRIFGDHIWVERLYSFLTAILTGYLITLLWRKIFKPKPELAGLSWLPFLLWIIIPLTSWSYRNNMLENTLGIFALTAVYLLITGLSSNRKTPFYLIISACLILAGFLSKGFVALFPLAVIGLYWLIFKNSSFYEMLFYTLILVILPALLLGLLCLLDRQAYPGLVQYFNAQIIPSLKGQRAVTERYYIALRLLKELSPLIILTALGLLFCRLKKTDLSRIKSYSGWILLFLGIGFSASLPMMISPKQLGFYLVPSFPYFSIGFAIILAPGLNELTSKINPKSRGFTTFTFISLILLIMITAISISQAGKIGRDRQKLEDIYTIGKIVPGDSVISICPSMGRDWSLHGYFARYFYISLDPGDGEHKYFLSDGSCDPALKGNYTWMQLKTNLYTLYKKAEE